MVRLRERVREGISRSWAEALGSGRLVVALVRHGRTSWNQERRFLGLTDIGLDDVGQAQAQALAVRFGRPSPFTAVYSSPLSRALHTAAWLVDPKGGDPAEAVARARVVPELRELAQGELEGLFAPEAIARFPDFFAAWVQDPTHARAPGGESLGECRDRGLLALEAIRKRHGPGELVAAVSHQMVISSVRCTVAGCGLREWRSYTVDNTGVSGLAWDGRAWELLDGDPPSLP